MRQLIKHVSVLLGLLFLSLFAPAAQAVVIQAGHIETSGTTATIDLIYFSVSDPGDTVISMSPFCGSCGVITTERSGIALYADDGSGGVGTFLEGDPGDAATVASNIDRLVIDGDSLAVGNYVLAVSWFDLQPGELGPIQVDSNVNLAFDYEVGFSGSAGTNATIRCQASGNLDGTFTLATFVTGASCQLPSSPVPEPATLFLTGLGLLGLPWRRSLVRASRRV